MELKLNSKSARLYRWFYGIEDNYMPTDMCVYYKKLPLAILFVIPVALLSFPVTIIQLINKRKYELGERLGFMVFLLMACFMLFLYVTPFLDYFGTFKPKSIVKELLPCGLLLWIMTILILLFYIIKAVIKKIKNIPLTKKESPLSVYIKSLKGKYCQRIVWKQ